MPPPSATGAITRPTLLLTRPEAASSRVRQALERQVGTRIPAVIAPLTEIVFTGTHLPRSAYGFIIFTSVNGVDAYLAAGGTRGLPCACVGGTTAAAARSHGMLVQTVAPTAGNLVKTLGMLLRPPGRCLWPRGMHARCDLAHALGVLGWDVTPALLYDQRACPPTDEARSLMKGHAPVITAVFSPRSGQLLADAWCGAAPLAGVAISAAAAKAAEGLAWRKLVVARYPNQAEVVKLLVAMWQSEENLPGGEARLK